MRWNSFSEYLKKKYPFTVKKIAIDAGFTCPNRDGVKGVGGCTYCNNKSFSPNTRGPKLTVEEQIRRGIAFYRARGADKFIAYFQAYTNTYAPLEQLKAMYDRALQFPEIVGVSIGTRPDCISNATLDYIESLSKRLDVYLEIGLETSHDRTLQAINRCHTYAEFEDAVRRAKGRGLELVAHTIFGLPGESRDEMMLTVERIGRLPLQQIKIHHLYIAPGTVMEEQYRRGEIRLFTFEEWVSLAADILERLPVSMVVQRLMGELGGEYAVAPLWGKTKAQVLQAIDHELARRGTRQGSRFAAATVSRSS